jgi:hypothetical protein
VALYTSSVVSMEANLSLKRKYILTKEDKNVWPAFVYKVVDFKRAPNVSLGHRSFCDSNKKELPERIIITKHIFSLL